MPAQDGTGPNGTYVNCMPQEKNEFLGARGYFCRGRGFRRGCQFLRTQGVVGIEPISKEQELSFLEIQKAALTQNLEGIEKRIKTLKTGK